MPLELRQGNHNNSSNSNDILLRTAPLSVSTRTKKSKKRIKKKSSRLKPRERVLHSSADEPSKLQKFIVCFFFLFLLGVSVLQVILVDYGEFGGIDHRFTSHIKKLRGFLHKQRKQQQQSLRRDALSKEKTNGAKKKEGTNKNGGILPLEDILIQAGVEVTPDLKAKLPSAQEVEALYGPRPIIHGLDTCQAFRDAVLPEDRFIAPAGMFNTGTNLMSEFLQANCAISEKMAKYGKERKGMRFQVPWGKHTPVSWRLHHTAEALGNETELIQEHVLPIVVIKDPYTWMSSMCRHPYAARWFHRKGRCPNLVPLTEEEKEGLVDGGGDGGSVPVTVNYPEHPTHHASLAHLWNEWYGDWYDKTNEFPFLVVRFEDLLFHAEEVVSQACHCAGGTMISMEGFTGGLRKEEDQVKKGFRYITESAKTGKAHKGSSSLAPALLRYSNATLRVEPYQDEDLNFCKRTLDQDLMDHFHY